MDLHEPKDTVDPEVRAYVYSLVSAVCSHQFPFGGGKGVLTFSADSHGSLEAPARMRKAAMF